MVRPLHHVFFTLFYSIHDHFHDIFSRRIIIYLKWPFKIYSQQCALLFKFQTFFIECSPESIYHNRNNDRLISFNDQRSSFSTWGKWFGSSLWECDHPVIIQCSFDLSCIRRIKAFSFYFAFWIPCSLYGDGAGQCKEPADKTPPHCFFSSY